MYITKYKKVMILYYNLMKTLNTSFQAIILPYFIPCLLMTHEMTVYDIFLCRHTLTRNTLDSDQSNYSSRIVFFDIPIEFRKPEIAAFDPPISKTLP